MRPLGRITRVARDDLQVLRDIDTEAFVDPSAPAAVRAVSLVGGALALTMFATVVAALLADLDYFANLGAPPWLWVLALTTAPVLGTFWWVTAGRLPMLVNDLLSVVGTSLITLGLYYATDLAGHVALFYVWIAVGVAAARVARVPVVHVATMAAAYGVIVSTDSGGPEPLARWLCVVVALVVLSGTAAFLIERLRRSALAERTARREAERVSTALADVSDRKTDFLAGMSHELRTPLNAIIGFSEVLRRRMHGDLNARQAGYVGDIVDSGHHLMALIDDMLDLGKVEAGRLELSAGEVDLRDVLEAGLVTVREQAARQGVSLGLEVHAAADRVVADERKVKQVVFNLLSNAVRFTRPGGRVTVTAVRSGTEVTVAVADTGVGIAAEDRERIFDEYTQGASSGEGVRGDGTGLGLPLSRRLVELHGGQLTVDSALGAGSTFMFTLPDRPWRSEAARAGRRGSSVGGRSDGQGHVFDPPAVARIAGTAALGFAAASGGLAWSVDAPEFDARAYEVGALLALAIGVGVLVTARRIPVWVCDLIAAVGVVSTTVGIYNAGPLRSFAPIGYLMITTTVFMCRPRSVGIALAGLVAVSYTVVLAIQPGNPAVRAQWITVVASVAMVGTVVSWLVGRVQSVADAEARARRDAERMSVELADVSQHKSAFLAGMSHELRTPLNAIIGFAEVLDRRMFGELNGRQAGYVTDIIEAGRHLLGLINDILDLAKIDAGRFELLLGEVDLAELIDGELRLAGPRAERFAIELEAVIDAGAARVVADERRLVQVVANLLSNALKFTPPGGRVSIGAVRRDDAVAVTVRDTGVGISMVDQARIFDEFARAESEATHAREGSGLGLALARRFVELHGGRLVVDSAPGAGSSFTFTIPDLPVQRSSTAAVEAPINA